MSDWNNIKYNIAEINNITKKSPVDSSPLNNEYIMSLFINKINLKYRFEPYYEVPFVEYTTRLFNKLNYENKNFFIEANKDNMINIYINSIKNILTTQFNIYNKSKKEININIDTNLLLISALQNLNLIKYNKLSQMLYEVDKKYLDLSKESIINTNKNISLDKMVYGIDMPKVSEHFDFNFNCINCFLIITLYLLVCVVILIKTIRK